MSTERNRERSGHLQHEAEHANPRKKVSVMGYLVILFAAAFLLLLMSFLMQQRSNESAQNALKDTSNSALQSIEKMLEDNQRLTDEVESLKQQAEELLAQTNSLQAQIQAEKDAADKTQRQLEAMDWFWRIQRAYSRGTKQEAKDLAQQFEATGLPAALPAASLSGAEGPSPAEQYDALLEAMDLKEAATP